jgi:uncharacterized membrane protein
VNRTDHLRVIFFAIVVSTVVYAIVVWAATYQRVDALSLEDELRSPITLGIYGAAAVMYIMAFVIPTRIARRSARYIVRWAMLESVAIAGLIVALIFNDWRLYLPPWIIALIGFSRAYPHREPR